MLDVRDVQRAEAALQGAGITTHPSSLTTLLTALSADGVPWPVVHAALHALLVPSRRSTVAACAAVGVPRAEAGAGGAGGVAATLGALAAGGLLVRDGGGEGPGGGAAQALPVSTCGGCGRRMSATRQLEFGILGEASASLARAGSDSHTA